MRGGCLATAAFLFWLYLGQKEYELLLPEGWLQPANEPTPPNVCDEAAPKNALKVLLGSQAAYTTKFPSTIISIDRHAVLTLDRTDKGAVAITTDIYDQKDEIVTEIKKNKFLISNDVFEHPRPDYSTLTVVIKRNKETVLDIRYLNPSTIRIIGTFRYPGSPPLKVGTDMVEFRTSNVNAKLFNVCAGDNSGAQFSF